MTSVRDETSTASQYSPSVAVNTPVRRDKLNIVLFSGGSGAHSITEALLRHPQISLTIIINAYDDGHSTGRLRRFIPGMLGPSDVRKNVNRLMPKGERCHKALQSLSDYRLAVGIPEADALTVVDAIADENDAPLDDRLQAWYRQLTVRQAKGLSGYCKAFKDYLVDVRRSGRTFNFTDCAIGNVFFAGCYLQNDQDFNATVRAFCAFYEVESTVLNVTMGENFFLVASKEDGSLLLNEAAIVSLQSSAMIDRIMLVGEELFHSEIGTAERVEGEGAAALRGKIERDARLPMINPDADAAIRAADVIIYGPGTQHSSLFPSYLTRGVAEALAANQSADKVFVGNIRRDFDIQKDDAGDLARKLLSALEREGELKLEWNDVVSHFFFQEADAASDASAYVSFDRNHITFPMEKVKLRDWEYNEGKHAGGYVVEELQAIVQSRMGIALPSNRHLVSIVVPAYNESRTVAETLTSLMALDFSPYGLGKEIILIDGGSTDDTYELAQGVRGVRVHRLKHGFGRGAAIRHGIERARGDLIVCFPADAEYVPSDVFALIGPILRNEFKAVFGARTIKCFDLTERLKGIYGRWGFTYLASKYGGMLLSMLTLLLYNRYVTDTLTSVKAFDGRLLRGLDLHSNGVDLDMELIAKLAQQRQFILEIPVSFEARTRAQGKKTSVMDGVRAAYALVRYSFA